MEMPKTGNESRAERATISGSLGKPSVLREILLVLAVAFAARFILVVPEGARSIDAFSWEKVSATLGFDFVIRQVLVCRNPVQQKRSRPKRVSRGKNLLHQSWILTSTKGKPPEWAASV
jgi:hypothetical protein